MANLRKISIVIPAHNEEERIEKTLKRYFDYFKSLKKKGILDFEIVVVLNACTDNTLKVVKKYSCRELRILEFEQGGKGFAIIKGFKDSLKRESELIGFVDADCSTPPESYYDLIKSLTEDMSADGAIANRWDKKSHFEYSGFKKLRSITYNFIIRSMFLFPYRDTQCGAKVFRRDVLEKIIHKMVSSDFNFDVALLFCLKKELNAKIKSVPTHWVDADKTRISLVRSPFRMILSAIRLRLVHSPFRFIPRAYAKLPSKLKIHKMLG